MGDGSTYGDLADNIECIALQPVRHVNGPALRRDLIEPLLKHGNAVVHIRFVRYKRAHRVHGRDLPAFLCVPLRHPFREDIRLIGIGRNIPRLVPL